MTHILKTFDELYDEVFGDEEFDSEIFKTKIDEMTQDGFICNGIVNDEIIYFAKDELKREEIVTIEDPIKRSTLIYLIKNPTTFFVLQNTQKGKMKIISKEIIKWSQDREYKVVAYIIVDNDKTLAEQSVDAIKRTFSDIGFKLFLLSSNNKTTFEDIKTYIDAYSNDVENEYFMPIIVLLSNKNQCEKMLKLVNHVHKKAVSKKSMLRNGIVWDECDKTYKSLRDLTFKIEDDILSCKTFMVDKVESLYRLGFVTATDGDLLESGYPECANAYLYPLDIPSEDKTHYRALQHPESKTHHVPYTSIHTNNSYAMEILEKNRDHFTQPITLSGTQEVYYRKIIVNSNTKTNDMKQFAKWCVKNGMYALVFNGYGGASVKVFRDGFSVESHKTTGKRLNETLFYIYKKLKLNDKPIVIIGRRKVDRGLGFHYCPRNNDEIIIDGTQGKLVTCNKEGLVWTDMILGSIPDKNTAVQKAGRLAGIIGESPQYHGSIDYWTDNKTEELVRSHNTMVDLCNDIKGFTVSEAVNEAKKRIPILTEVVVKKSETISNLEEFSSMNELNKRWKIINENGNVLRQPNKDEETGKYKCSIGSKSETHDIKEVRDKVGGTSMAYWGEGYTGAKNGDIIHRVYVGYDEDIPVFVLRWAKVVKDV
jgi:hypothetical protein